jgi:hypothetical protein
MKKSELQRIIQEEITTALSSPQNPATPSDKEDANVANVISRLKPVATSLKNIDTPKELMDLFTQTLDMIQGLNKSSLSDQEIIMAFTNALTAYRKKK